MNSDLFVYPTGCETEAVPKATPISGASAAAEETLPFLPKGAIIVVLLIHFLSLLLLGVFVDTRPLCKHNVIYNNIIMVMVRY